MTDDRGRRAGHRLGDAGDKLDDAELERHVTLFQSALRRMHEDPAEAARIDALVTDAERKHSGIAGRPRLFTWLAARPKEPAARAPWGAKPANAGWIGRLLPIGDYRWRRFGRAAAGLLPAFFTITWAAFWSLSGEISYASGAAGILTLAAAVSATLTARAAWASRLTPRWHLNMIVVSWSLTVALTAALILVARRMPVLPAAGARWRPGH